jgi:hypothetical protein
VLFVNDSKKEKIMKKVLYSVLALAGLFAVSCAKEMNSPEDANIPTHEVTIVATGSLDTKTSYADGKTFSWVVRDSVYVYTTDGSAGEFVKFYAKSTAATSEFTGEVKDGYRPSSIAFYPAEDSPVTLSGKTYTYLPIIYKEEGRDPYSYTPMVGIAQKDGSFKFSTATGLIKFSFTDLDEKASFVHLKTTGEKISGYFFLNENPYYEMTNAIPAPYASYGLDYMLHEFVRKPDGTAEVVIPIPVGTIKAGCNVMIEDENENVLFQTTTTKDIVVEPNKVVEIAPLKAKYDWQNVGTGKYIDTRVWADAGWDITKTVDVKIETNGEGVYRVANPYGAAAAAFDYTIPSTAYGPDDYLTITVLPVGSTLGNIKTTIPGLVNFEKHNTGIVNTKYGVDPFIAHPARWYTTFPTEDYYVANIVTKYATDGTTPAALQLAPRYFWLTDPDTGKGSASNAYLLKNSVVQLLFPGEENLFDLTYEVEFDSMVDETPAQPIAKANVKVGKDVQAIDIVVAANAEAAEAAFSAGTNVVKVTETSSVNVNFPADAKSGSYYIFGKASLDASFNQAMARMISSEEIKYTRTDEWVSLGTGKFVDNYNWSYMGSKATEDALVDVEILANTAEPGHYRLVDPYGAAATAFSYTPSATVTAPSEFVDVYVQTGGYIDFDDFCTGVYYPAYAEATTCMSPKSNNFGYGRNYVMKYLADGTTPANIAIAPVFYWPKSGYWTGSSYIDYDGLIQIVFPGATSLVDITATVKYVEITDDTPETAKAKVNVILGSDLSAVKLVIAANATAAKVAMAEGSKVTTATTSGDIDVALPDNPETGDYSVFYTTVPAEGISDVAIREVEEAGSFKYVNPNDDAGWTLADLLGTYKSNNMYIAWFNGSAWQWGENNNYYTIVIEETNDELQGDFRITSIVCETEKSAFNLSVTEEYGPIYGYFNTKTGEVTVPGGQTMYWAGANAPVLWKGSRQDMGVDLFLDKAGHLTTNEWQCKITTADGKSNYRLLGGVKSVLTSFTRVSVPNSAPVAVAKVNKKQQSYAFSSSAEEVMVAPNKISMK